MVLACQRLVKRAGAEDSDLTWMDGEECESRDVVALVGWYAHVTHAPGVNR
jgi:hypothetical protein